MSEDDQRRKMNDKIIALMMHAMCSIAMFSLGRDTLALAAARMPVMLRVCLWCVAGVWFVAGGGIAAVYINDLRHS